MVKTAPKTETLPLYDRDFHAWTQEQARLLRERRFEDLDLANLVEEVESVGAADKREIRSRLEVIIAHLLEWQYQPGLRASRWRDTLDEQRSMLAEIAVDSPSLDVYVREQALKRYRAGVLAAARQTGLAMRIFPKACPFAVDEILDPDFYPREADE
jgi:hypothetical protein